MGLWLYCDNPNLSNLVVWIYSNLMTCFISNTFKKIKDVSSCKDDIIYLWCIAFELDFNIASVEFLVF
jgi:hypothetical protein